MSEPKSRRRSSRRRRDDLDPITGPAGPAVLCGKCETLSPIGTEECPKCGADLYEECDDCGVVKPKVAPRCPSCDPAGVRSLIPESMPEAPRGKAILCRHCDRLNPQGIEDCDRCGRALFVVCEDCGERRPRIIESCPGCEQSRQRRTHVPAPAMVLPKGRGVLCAECDHLNPTGIEECELCHRALFSICRHCGNSKPRNQTKCPTCQPPEAPRVEDLTPVSKPSGRGVLCANCEHLNPQGLQECETCERPLFLTCKECGTPRARVLRDCPVCKPPEAVPVEIPAEQQPRGKGVLCSRCDRLNPQGIDECDRCGTSLFTVCEDCGEKKPRNSRHCPVCARNRALEAKPVVVVPTLTAEERGPKGRGILCAECEHLNPPNLRECESCSADLFDECPECGSEKQAVRVECSACEEKERARAAHRRESGPSGRATLCGKCDHLNPFGLKQCETCGEDLFVTCPDCQITRPAVVTECATCLGTVPRARDLMDPTREKGRGLLCKECEHLNPSGLEQCERCDEDLYVNCHRCDHRNLRIRARCERCRRRLQQSMSDRIKSGPDRSPASVLGVILGALLLLGLMAFGLWWAGFRLPRLW